MKKNGFISMTLLYTFFILFLVLMIHMMNSYSRNKNLLDKYRNDIKQNLYDSYSEDINVYFYVYNNRTSSYELVDDLGSSEYEYISELSNCTEGYGSINNITYDNGDVLVSANSGAVCKAYFKKLITNHQMTYYIENGDYFIEVDEIPDSSYEFIEAGCDNGASIIFDEYSYDFIIDSDTPTSCWAAFR